jgi:hypothetical protein
MSITDLFFSPTLKPFRKLARLNNGKMAILVEVKKSRREKPSRSVYIANNFFDLRNKVRELHRVQVTMGVPIASKADSIDASKPYLIYCPLSWKFRIEGDTITNISNGDVLTINTKRCIAHKKKGFIF